MIEGLVRKVESVLFGSGKRMPLAHIAQLCKISVEEAAVALAELKREYESKDTSLRVVQDGDFWKLTVRDAYAETVQKLVTQTELSKTVMETLAVIAYKSPVLQSEVIRIRTNKAYDHLLELEQIAFITRVKQGRTKLIKLAPKFFEYFDLPEDAARARFATVREKEREVSEHDEQRKQLLEQIKLQKEKTSETDDEQRRRDEERLKQLDSEIAQIEKLETYPLKETFTDQPPSPLEPVTDTVGKLEVYETESKEGAHWGDFEVYTPPKNGSEEGEGDKEEIMDSEEQEPSEHVEVSSENVAGEGVDLEPLEHKEGKGMFSEGIPVDVQQNINKRIDDMLHTTAQNASEADGEHEDKSEDTEMDASEQSQDESPDEEVKEALKEEQNTPLVSNSPQQKGSKKS